MRFAGPAGGKGGNLTESPARQPQLGGLDSVGDSLSRITSSDMTACSSGKIVAMERGSSESQVKVRGNLVAVRLRPSGTAPQCPAPSCTAVTAPTRRLPSIAIVKEAATSPRQKSLDVFRLAIFCQKFCMSDGVEGRLTGRCTLDALAATPTGRAV